MIQQPSSKPSHAEFFKDKKTVGAAVRRWLNKGTLISLCFILVGVSAAYLYFSRTTLSVTAFSNTKPVIQKLPQVILQTQRVYIHRSAVNKIVEQYIKSGYGERVYAFYDKFTGDRNLTFLIVTDSLANDVPLNLSFAIVKKESQFVPGAIDGQNRDGSKDYGLYQLNADTFSGYTPEQLLDPERNARLATVYLKELHDKYKSWDAALLVYNGGTLNGVKAQVVAYLTDTLRYESEYDAQFAESF